MKKITLLTICFLIFTFSWQASAQFSEDFEVGVPGQFTETQDANAASWGACGGSLGGQTCPISGSTSATFFDDTYEPTYTSLTTPTLDLSAGNYRLKFKHSQLAWGTDQNTMLVEISTDDGSTWTTIENFVTSISAVTSEEYALDTYTTTSTSKIRFTGKSVWGRSVVLDDVVVEPIPACTPPVVNTTTVNENCAGSEFIVEVDITSLGDATSLTLSNDAGVASTAITAVGVAAAGPFPIGTNVNLTLEHDQDAACNLDLQSFADSCPAVNDTFAGAIPITPSSEGTGCGSYNFTYSSDGTSDSGKDNTCQTTNTGLDRFYSWTATSLGLTWNDGIGAPGIAVWNAAGDTEITCSGTFAATDTILSGWSIGDNLVIQIYDFDTSVSDISFCLEEYTPPPAPNCATTPTPANGSVDISVGTITLNWDAPVSGPTPTAYNLYSGALADGSDLGLVGEFASNTADVTVNGFDTTIYWQVRPLNGSTEATGCDIWNFTTVSPPTGSTCTDPIVVTSLPYNETAGTTNGFGDDYDASPGSSCGTTSGYLNGDDIVYSYTASSDASINFSLTNITDTYTGLFVYADCTDIGATCLAGDYNSGSTSDLSVEEFSVTSGTTYYVVISTWASPQSTSYDLAITENTCTSATVVPTVVNDCAVSGGFLIDLDVTSLGSATSLQFYDGTDFVTVTATGTVQYGPYTNGTLVDFQIDPDDDSSCTLFLIDLTQEVCPPANDSCAGAIEITPGVDFAANPLVGSNIGATGSGETPIPSCSSYDPTDPTGFGGDLWYSVVVPADGNLTIEIDNNGGPSTDSGMQVYSGTCGDLLAVECDDDDGNGAFSQVVIESVDGYGGETLLVRVFEYGGNSEMNFLISAFSATLGLDTVQDQAAFTYYPNPVNNILTLDAQKNIESVVAYNMLGQEVLRLSPNTVNTEVDMSSLTSGAYFVKVSIQGATKTIRVIKQ